MNTLYYYYFNYYYFYIINFNNWFVYFRPEIDGIIQSAHVYKIRTVFCDSHHIVVLLTQNEYFFLTIINQKVGNEENYRIITSPNIQLPVNIFQILTELTIDDRDKHVDIFLIDNVNFLQNLKIRFEKIYIKSPKCPCKDIFNFVNPDSGSWAEHIHSFINGYAIYIHEWAARAVCYKLYRQNFEISFLLI